MNKVTQLNIKWEKKKPWTHLLCMCNVIFLCDIMRRSGSVVPGCEAAWLTGSHWVGGGLITPRVLITSRPTSHKGSPQCDRWAIFSNPSACWSRLEVCEVCEVGSALQSVCAWRCVSRPGCLTHINEQCFCTAHWLSFTIHEPCWKELFSPAACSLSLDAQHRNDNTLHPRVWLGLWWICG